MADQKVQQAQLDVLIGTGKEMGASLLRNAEQSAKTPHERSSQIFVTQIAGCHILALCAFAQEQNGENVDGDAWLDETVKQIKLDLENIRKAFEASEAAAAKKTEGPKLIL